LEFQTGYLVEYSLSIDNIFVFVLLFSYFAVPAAYQHRVLFWGILSALILRGVMIGIGVAFVEFFHWALYLFGAFLLFTGLKMFFSRKRAVAECISSQRDSMIVAWHEVPGTAHPKRAVP
jgi:tellurite resistance protein TerC